MRKFLFSFLLLLLPFEAHSDPVKYRFEGTVSGLYGTGPSRDNLGLNYGDPVAFEFLVNTSGTGYTLYGDGSFSQATDGEDSVQYFAELLYMSYTVEETYYHSDYTNFVGRDDFCTCLSEPVARLFAGPPMFYFDGPYPRSDWEIGQQVGGLHGWHDSVTEDYISMLFNLSVTEITKLPANFKGASYNHQKQSAVGFQ